MRIVQHRRHWSVDEANRSLGFVGQKIDRLRALVDRMEESDAEEGYAIAGVEAGGGWPGREPAAAAVEVALILQLLDDLDIVVRDLEQGLIDFPALRGGEEVYLCWLRDEPRVEHWHAPETGFSGRRPL